MKTLFSKINKLKKEMNIQYCMDENLSLAISKKYNNIPFDIIKYFFVRHSEFAEQILKDIIPLQAKDIRISTKSLNKTDLLNKNLIDHAPFATGNDFEVPENCRNEYYNSLKEAFPFGTWEYPIITIVQNNKYLVLDGNNRFARLKIAIRYNFDFVGNTHKIYVLN